MQKKELFVPKIVSGEKKIRIKCNILPKITSQSNVSLELQYFLKLTVFKGVLTVPLIPLELTGSVMALAEYCSEGTVAISVFINLIISVERI